MHTFRKHTLTCMMTCLLIHQAATQSFDNENLTVKFGTYFGGSFLARDAIFLPDDYYDDLRFGVNYGGEVIAFYQNIGIGFNYDQMNFSAKGFQTFSSQIIDEDMTLRFFGPLLATKTTLAKYHHFTAYFSYGRQVYKNDAVIDGINSSSTDKKYISKISVKYEYEISQFLIGAGLQYLNGGSTGNYSLQQTSIIDPFTGTSTTYRYNSGVNLDRLGASINVSFRF